MFRRWLLRAHLYCALFGLTGLGVYGAVGLHALWAGPFAARPAGEVETATHPWRAPAGAGDAEVEALLRARFAPAASPLPPAYFGHDPAGRLTLDLFSPNGLTHLTVDDAAGLVHLRRQRVGLLEFLNRIHALSWRTPSPHPAVRAWAWYNLTALAALGGMAVTGLLLHRPSLPAALASLGLLLLLLGALR